jgi:hypothetical protein
LVLIIGLVLLCQTTFAAGLSSSGNTDGLLTWRLGDLAPGRAAREVAIFTFDKSRDGAARRLEEARRELANLPEPPSTPAITAASTVWLKNEATDFALQGPGHFFWEGGRQSLAFSGGGQLSRFGYYVHYGEQRAGTPITNQRELENLRVVEPVRAVRAGFGVPASAGKTSDNTEAPPSSVAPPPEGGTPNASLQHAAHQAVGVVETTDGKLSLRLRALLGEGPLAAVEFMLTNTGDQPLRDVRLTAYANLEAAHDHENDFSALDAQTGALVVTDLPTERCVLMAGLGKPSSGFSGTWASENQLKSATGVPFAQWTAFAGIPADVKKALAAKRGGIFDEYAPAPPVEPREPETRALTAAEANAVLRQDWLFQAEGKPLAERARQELKWTRELAARIAAHPKKPDLRRELDELEELALKSERNPKPETGTVADGSEALRTSDFGLPPDFGIRSSDLDLYFAVRSLKRRIALKNPVVDFSRVLLIDQPYPAGREWQHQVRHRNGMMAVPGGRLLVLDGLHPGGIVRKLAPDRPAAFWRPDLSFDARRVLFCMKRHDEKAFHLFEVGLDGSGLRQITDGPYDDLDPIYLPSGQIIFSTTRGNTFIRCMPYTYSYILARCDADGRNLYLISGASEPEWLPTLLNDGRVVFSRWDYIDKALWRIQSLWTCQQDGTAVETLWGNQSVWPDHQAEARPIPGSARVMFTGLAHHDWFAGSIGIIDPTKGRNFPHGLTKVTADVDWPECGKPPLDPIEAADYHTSGKFDAYKSPYPLSEEDFLVSARRDGKFRLYLMDVHGNRELIYEGAHHVWHALPVKPRTPPPQHSDLVAWPGTGNDRKPPQPGTFYSANVCEGVPDLPRERVKALRVLQMDHKTYSLWTRDGRFSGPAVSALQDDGVKRILGTVPVQADGSVYFKVPPGVVLYFQLLDEHQRALQTMRSSVSVMPGERRSCVGCHEQHTKSPVATTSLALREAPRELTPPPWGATSLSFERMVQPVLDRYCGRCHSGSPRGITDTQIQAAAEKSFPRGEAKGRAALDLTLRPGNGVFKEPYLTLLGPIGFGVAKKPHQPGLAGALMCENFEMSDPDSYATTRPLQHLSYTSPLIDLCLRGDHYDTKLDPVSLQTLIGWVDANCPYRGDEDVREIPDPEFAGIDELPVRPRTKTAPVSLRP